MGDLANGFVHLRVRSAYSLLEGAIKADALPKLAGAQGMPAVGIADRANLFGALEFSVAAKDAGVQPLALGADKQWIIAGQAIRTGGQIGPDRLAHNWQHRHQPLFASLADDANAIAHRIGGAVQTKSLPDAQAAAVKQSKQRLIAQTDPGLVILFGQIEQGRGVLHLQRSWRAFGDFRWAQCCERANPIQTTPAQEPVKASQCRDA